MSDDMDYRAAYYAERVTRQYAERELLKARHALQAERERVRVLKDALRVCVETLEEAKFPDWSSPDHCAKISRGVLNMVEAQEPGGVDGGPENGEAVD